MFSKERAINILKDFEGANLDGVGSVYVDPEGKFKVEKFPFSLTQLLDQQEYPFLKHMPYPGWTLAHLRAASHGCNADRNTHPFVVGDAAYIHNGVWSDYKVAKLLLQKFVGKMQGETDSEVAANTIKLVGPKKFMIETEYAGVFMCLNLNGTLDVIKTSGSLEAFCRKDKSFLFGSSLPSDYKKSYEVDEGWYRYNKHGKHVKHKLRPSNDEKNGVSWRSFNKTPTYHFPGVGNSYRSGLGVVKDVAWKNEEESTAIPAWNPHTEILRRPYWYSED